MDIIKSTGGKSAKVQKRHADYAPNIPNADYANILNTDPLLSNGETKG